MISVSVSDLKWCPWPMQALFQLQVVLDDAVVHHHEAAGLVRMGIDLRGPAVGGPAGVADARSAAERALAQQLLKTRQLPLGAADFDVAAAQAGDPGRIVAAILEAAQAVEDDGGRVTRSDVADNSAHIQTPLLTGISNG